jgi:hypothetical protein
MRHQGKVLNGQPGDIAEAYSRCQRRFLNSSILVQSYTVPQESELSDSGQLQLVDSSGKRVLLAILDGR